MILDSRVLLSLDNCIEFLYLEIEVEEVSTEIFSQRCNKDCKMNYFQMD